jgi:hypothetical protein
MTKELLSANAKELTAKLQERYEIGRTQTYKRLNHLGIQLIKGNGETWLETEQLEGTSKNSNYTHQVSLRGNFFEKLNVT